MTLTLLSLVALAALPQDPIQPVPAGAAEPPAGDETRAEALKNRIHDMRMNLLLGGDRVRQAEAEAVDFYELKSGQIDQQIDVLRSDLSVKRASYNVALERALNAPEASARQAAMKDATVLRREIDSIEADSSELGKRRKNLSSLIDVVNKRGRERETLAAKIETSSGLEDLSALPFAGIGLAPVVEPEPVQPALDDALVADLMKRDPRRARQVLFEADPNAYWQRFPLQPPTDVLREAFTFPLPDLPGSR